MEPISLIYTTFATKEDAVEILSKLIKENVATCGNIAPPHTAIYPWKGKLQQEEEIAVYIKAPESKFEKLVDRLHALHPYDLPCILSIEAGALPDYAQWLEKP